MNRIHMPVIVLAVSFAAGCAEGYAPLLEPAQAVGTVVPNDCGRKTAVRDSRARLDWTQSTAIRGDARGNVYQGDQDGVHAKIFYHNAVCFRSGDLVFDPDLNAVGNNRRRLTFFFPSGRPEGLAASAEGAPFVTFRALQFLGSDIGRRGVIDARDAKVEEKQPGALRGWEYPLTSAELPGYPGFNGVSSGGRLRFTETGIAGCNVLEYARVKLTRIGGLLGFQPTGESLPDGTPLGQWSDDPEHRGTWVAESASSMVEGAFGHWAQCYTTASGSPQRNGSPMNMPFRVMVHEIR